MFEIKLPDGSVRNCDKEITVLDFAKNLSISLAKKKQLVQYLTMYK